MSTQQDTPQVDALQQSNLESTLNQPGPTQDQSITSYYSNVKVAVKLCPVTLEEQEAQAQNIIEIVKKKQLFAYHPESKEGLLYKFDYCFHHTTSQKKIFEAICVPAVNAVLEGYSSAIIAYGPPKTGKTGLLFGTKEEPGIINMTLKEMFTYIASVADKNYAMTVSYWEMNNDSILDLLHPDYEIQRKIRRHPEHGVFITNLAEVELSGTWEELEELIESGNVLSQKITATRGTRWHSFIKLNIIRQDKDHPETTIRSQLLFANLKGSDRIGQMGAKGQLLRQGASLNKSNTAFANVILNVASTARKELHNTKDIEETKKSLPRKLYSLFGDSKVTKVLSDAFGTSWCTTIISCISPTEYHYLETMDTLENLRAASLIPTFPKRGDLDTEANRIFKELTELKAKMPPDPLAPGHPKTEMQEQLDELQEKFDRITRGAHMEEKEDEDEKLEPIPQLQVHGTQLWKLWSTLALRHGKRKRIFHPRNKKITYEGQWCADEKSGYGVYIGKRIKYEGMWKNNKRHGMGTLYEKQKDGTYRRVYKGHWEYGKKSGEGIYYYKNGEIYQGSWKNDKRDGEGSMWYLDGSLYKGNWKDDKKHGIGKTIEKNGDIFEGEHFNDMRNGPGVFYYMKQGRMYKGEWYNGIPKCGEFMEIPGQTENDQKIPILTLLNVQSVLEDAAVIYRLKLERQKQEQLQSEEYNVQENSLSDVSLEQLL